MSKKVWIFRHIFVAFLEYIRTVGRPENPGMPVLFGGHNLPPGVEIGLTDLPKSAPGTTPLYELSLLFFT